MARRMTRSGDALDVLARSGVDADPVAFFHEERDMDDCPCFESGGLGGALGSVTLHAGIALRDGEFDEARQPMSVAALPEQHVDLDVLQSHFRAS